MMEDLPGLDRDSAQVSRIQDMIRESEMERHVTILGFREDVERLLQGADIYLHTAIEEAHGRTVIEAMVMGLPAVAFSVDGVAESIIDGQTGYLVSKGDVAPLADALLRLTGDRTLRERMGNNGRRRAEEQFSARSTAQQVGNVIDGVLDGEKPDA